MSMTIKTDAFEGPLDLLLHLIEKNKMSIYDIQIAPITSQYMAHLRQLESDEAVSLESISDFILMAATLLYIKSKMLLPKQEMEEAEEDPRAELVQRLLEYKKMKHISQQLKEHEKDAEKIFYRNSQVQLEGFVPETVAVGDVLGNISMEYIYEVFADIVNRQTLIDSSTPQIDDLILSNDIYTIKEKSRYLLDLIEINHTIVFHKIFDKHTKKIEMIVTFMALLELVHKRKIKIYQKYLLGDIWISGMDGDEAIGY